MNRQALTFVLVLAVAIFSVVQAFQINGLDGSISGNTIKQNTAKQGESYDDMMARMHPDQVKATKSTSAPTMVGGC